MHDWLLFDLDDTLYAGDSGLWDAISRRIYTYMHDVVSIPPDDIDRLRKGYLETYGTTLAGLMKHNQVDPFDYLDFVHDVPLEPYVQPDSELQAMLSSLPQQKAILTNASEDHAHRILKRLGIDSHFSSVIGVATLAFINKPHPDAFHTALDLLGDPDPHTCMLIDDRTPNLMTANRLGMGTVLVGPYDPLPWLDAVISRVHDLPQVFVSG